MIRPLVTLLALAVLAGCAASTQPPNPDRPDCVKSPDKAPIDGGIGGTGREEDPSCRTIRGRK